jgi:hypothetical protein
MFNYVRYILSYILSYILNTMSFSLVNQIEELKEKLTDNEYKELLEEGMLIFNNLNVLKEENDVLDKNQDYMLTFSRALIDSTAEALVELEVVEELYGRIVVQNSKLQRKLKSANDEIENIKKLQDRASRINRGVKRVRDD